MDRDLNKFCVDKVDGRMYTRQVPGMRCFVWRTLLCVLLLCDARESEIKYK